MSTSRHFGRPIGKRRSLRQSRAGSYVAELLFAMPVLVVFLWAVIEFGVYLSNMQSVALAARVGAEAAAEATVAQLNAGVPPGVVSAVNQQLGSSGISPDTSYLIRVENDVGGAGQVVFSSDGTGAATPWGPNCQPQALLSPPLPPGGYVRVSICVPMAKLMPNLLALFGFDVSVPTRVASRTTVMLHK